MKTYYVTTPIYYTNGPPHLGHAYTTIAADVIARFRKLQGYDVFFITGTDEHGQKVEKAARERGKQPKQFVDEIAQEFKDLWKDLDIEYDKFIRTTDTYHEKAVQKVFEKIYKKGFIYKGTYEGWYCVPCETFLTDTQLVDNKCPECKRAVQREKEETYFFKLSAFKQQLKTLFEENREFVEPESRWLESYNFFKDELRDLSVSRKHVKWGIPVPFDKEHTIYVWYDALYNYLTGLGYDGENPKTAGKHWPADVHLVGKEIAKFHAVYWPAMLIADGLQVPKKIFAHGWWTIEGEKMSKSTGNYVEPREVVSKYGADAFRYFLLRENSFGEDGNYSQQAFVSRYNGELADELGNLANRTLVMTHRYCNGIVPKKTRGKLLAKATEEKVKLYVEHMEHFRFNRALENVWKILREANKLVNEKEPWKLAKQGKQSEVDETMYELIEALRISAILLYPFIPRKALELHAAIGAGDVKKAKLKNTKWGASKQGAKASEKLVLFPKVE